MKKELLKSFLLGILSIVLVISCTDLEIEESDSQISDSETEFTGVSDVESSLNGLYGSLRSIVETQEDLYALNEVTSDELLVPTRGTDWGDNGTWRQLHAHTWSSIHPYVLNSWNSLNRLVFNSTLVIDDRSNATDQEVAEAKFIRAYSMFWVMDMYGVAPFRSPDDGPDVNPMVMSRAEALDFIIADLTEALADLPATGPGVTTSIASKAAVNHLLAKLYLNKHIYIGGAPAAADMTKVVELVDAIAVDGFGLETGYFDIFTSDVDNETIFYTTSSVGNRMWNTLHYNQNAPDNTGGGWNGWSTLAEFYDLFEGDPNINVPGSGQEERRGFVPTDGSNLGIGFGFLIGQQYDETGAPLNDRPGNPLVFTKDFPGLVGNNERTGVRVIKYHPVNGEFAGHQIVFRYADAHLMKAEAILRGGTSGEDALTLVNNLRMIRNASPLTSLSEQDLLNERGRELYGEFWRRNDQIRFGKFAETWGLKDSTDDFRVLFPIPETALLSNTNLTQNPGY
ncbi:RagB/SusD family nutrient uptake outer membrane protein [Aquimarina sp. 2304DJ70-9]|uniref:RagB/SusD family nutrient uptake outer membrane protein n=1 Tax=Aquimarina penaris TaxID=3231044 RepID=UPI0034626837